MIICAVCLMGIGAMAQEINAISATQGETTDWYPFGKNGQINVTITNGNPEIEGGKTYDLSKGNVETAFGTDPLPAIKEAAIAEINNVATNAKNTIDALGVYYTVRDEAKNEIDNAVATAEASINNATSEDDVKKAKNDALNEINKQLANVQDYYEKLQAAKQTAINDIQTAAATAKEEIDELGVDENAKNEANAQIDNIVNTAKSTINNATSKDAIDNAKTEAIAEIYNVVQNLKDMWITVRENMTVGNYGTLCWNYNLTDIEGAELYRVTGKENNLISLEEVLVSETQAGAGYVIRATAKSLRVKNGDLYTDTPLPAAECNGLQGTFEEIVDGVAGTTGNILEGNYIIYNNEWRKCGGYTGLHAYSAYLIMNYVPGGTVTQAPNRKYISMPLPKETPTELESVNGSQCTMHNGKFLRNGQLIIVKDNKMYNAQGIEL